MFTPSLDGVLKGLTKTLEDLQKVSDHQGMVASKADQEIANLQVVRIEADTTQACAIRIADKLNELLS